MNMLELATYWLRYCPRTLLVLPVLANTAFFATAFAYPAMALTMFDTWYWSIKAALLLCLASGVICTGSAWVVHVGEILRGKND